MKQFLLVSIFSIMLLPIASAAGQEPLTVQVDRTEIYLGQSFHLIIKATDGNASAPDTSPLEKDFFVFGSSFQSSTSIINGQRRQELQWIVTLQPKVAGVLKIPALQVGNHKTQSGKIEILDAITSSGSKGNRGGTKAPSVLVEVEVDNQNPYVQSKVLVTAKVWMDESILGGSLTDPELEGALLERVGEDKSYSEDRDGQRYQVIERRYALFPQSSGTVDIPALIFEGTQKNTQESRRSSGFGDSFFQDPFFGSSPFGGILDSGMPIRAVSQAVSLKVRPKPEEARSSWWLPAQHLDLLETWEPESPVFRVGEPVTRNLVLRAVGLAADQFPTLDLDYMPNCKFYPGEAESRTTPVDGEIVSIMVQPVVLVPTEPGSLTLPAIEVPWWDIQSDSMQYARLEAQRIEVLPALGAALETAGGSPPAQGKPFAAADASSEEELDALNEKESFLSFASGGIFWGSLGVGSLLVGAGVILQRRKRQIVPSGDCTHAEAPLRKGDAENRLRSAVSSGDLSEISATLFHLGQVLWPEHPPKSLVEIGERLESEALVQEIHKLEELRFGGGGQVEQNWDPEVLLKAYRDARKVKKVGRMTSPLAPLYPQGS